MNDERDPLIQNLFDATRREAPGDTFVTGVMTKVNRLRYRTLLVWGIVGMILLVGVAMLSGPVTEAVALLSRLLPRPLVQTDFGNTFLTQALAPLNSVAGVTGLGLLALIFAFRKISGRC